MNLNSIVKLWYTEACTPQWKDSEPRFHIGSESRPWHTLRRRSPSHTNHSMATERGPFLRRKLRPLSLPVRTESQPPNGRAHHFCHFETFVDEDHAPSESPLLTAKAFFNSQAPACPSFPSNWIKLWNCASMLSHSQTALENKKSIIKH